MEMKIEGIRRKIDDLLEEVVECSFPILSSFFFDPVDDSCYWSSHL